MGSAKVIPIASARGANPQLAALVTATVDGDVGAADKLLRHVAPALLKSIRGVLGPQNPDVEDVLQDAMVRFLKALPGYRSECTVLHYAVRIGIRAAADSARSHARRRRLSEAYATHRTSLPPSGPNASRTLEERELLGWLLADTLSPVQIEALLMRHAMGYSMEEVADATEVPLNTVRSRLGAGKRALRARLDAEPELARLLGGGLSE